MRDYPFHPRTPTRHRWWLHVLVLSFALCGFGCARAGFGGADSVDSALGADIKADSDGSPSGSDGSVWDVELHDGREDTGLLRDGAASVVDAHSDDTAMAHADSGLFDRGSPLAVTAMASATVIWFWRNYS